MKNKKKLIRIVFFLLLGNVTMGEEISIEDLLQKIEQTSSEKKSYEITKEKLNVVDKYNKLGIYNGISVEATPKYNREDEIYEIEGSVTYGDFYIKGSKDDFYDSKTGVDTDTKVAFGVNKNINDMLYSSYDNRLNKNEIEKKIQENYFNNNMEDEKIELINLYVQYKTYEFEIKLKENNLNGIISEEEIVKKSYDLGASSKIDLDALSFTKKNLELEIETAKRKLKTIEKQFLYNFSIDISKYTLKDLTPKITKLAPYINNIGSREIKNLEYQMKQTKEEIKYQEYNEKYPEISIGIEHVKETDTNVQENRVYMTISKELFNYNDDLETEKLNLSEYEIKYKETKDDVISNRLEVENKYNEYFNLYKIAKNKSEYEKSEYEIKKLEYKLGEAKYTDVIDAFDDYLDAEILTETSKNKLNGYIYEIITRGERNE